MDCVKRLQDWYKSNCNGDWEHLFGVAIDTLDNPGWSVTIDLAGTNLQGVSMEPVSLEVSDADWLLCEVKGEKFIGVGGPENLIGIMEVFWKLIEKNAAKG